VSAYDLRPFGALDSIGLINLGHSPQATYLGPFGAEEERRNGLGKRYLSFQL
jgi:hypothetical protein